MKNFFTSLRARGAALKVAVAAFSLALASGAHAELPAWATGLGTQLTTSINDASDAVGTPFIIALTSLIVFKLIKRFAGKI